MDCYDCKHVLVWHEYGNLFVDCEKGAMSNNKRLQICSWFEIPGWEEVKHEAQGIQVFLSGSAEAD